VKIKLIILSLSFAFAKLLTNNSKNKQLNEKVFGDEKYLRSFIIYFF